MELSVVIQAGGTSRRMGRNKSLVLFQGAPMIQRVCDRLASLGDELIVTTNQPEELAFLRLPCFPDLVPDRGALGGLYTALYHARGPLVAVVACDMPFANPDLLRFACVQAAGSHLAIPRSTDGLEPLHAVYQREHCLPAVREALDAGKWRVDSWFGQVQVRILEPAEYAWLDPGGHTFINANTPAELAVAEALAAEQARDGR
jgi:molybdopterin-guanine dinucleotide biosynthesis protein A